MVGDTPVSEVEAAIAGDDRADLGATGAVPDEARDTGAGETATIAEPKPLRRFFAYRLLSEVELTGGIWILYLLDRGLSLGEIGLAEACFHLAPLTLELPSGSFADVLGRKWSLAIGGLLVALSAALMLGAPSLWMVLLGMYLGGASYAFRSGAQQAFLYDALAETAHSDRFTKVFGRLLSGSFIVLALAIGFGAALAGGRVGDWLASVARLPLPTALSDLVDWSAKALAHENFARSYVVMIGVGLVVAWLAAGLREPERERGSHRSLIRTIGEALQIVRGRPSLGALLGFTAALWTMLTLIGLYAQAVLQERGLSTSAVGWAIAASLVCTAAGSWFAPRLTVRGSFPAWTVGVTAAIVAGGLGLGGAGLAVGLFAYLAAEFASGLFEPLLANRVNAQVAAAQRATILSIEGFLFSLTMIWAFPLFGWVAERAGWLIAYAGAGGIVAVLLAVWLVVGRESSLLPSAASDLPRE